MVPYKLRTTKTGSTTLFAFSLDKVIRNIDMLGGWLQRNPDAAARLARVTGVQSLESPEFRTQFQNYLQNQANGYRGDGLPLRTTPDTRPEDIPDPTPGYTPVQVPEGAARLINSLMGLRNAIDYGEGATASQSYVQRLAKANGAAVVEAREMPGRKAGETVTTNEFNLVNKELRDIGFDPKLFHVAIEQLRLNRIVDPVKVREDLNVRAPVQGTIQIGFMPRALPIPERFTGTGEEAGRRGAKVTPPGFFARYDTEDYIRGGKYVDTGSGEDITGRVYQTGSIDVSTGRPSLQTSDVQAALPASGRKIRTNLFKQSAGWKWVGEAPSPTSTLVSVEIGNDHVYTLNAQFDTPVELARYAEKKSEPRLRPTTRGVLQVGDKVGEIEVRGRVHPVYDKVTTATDAPGRGIVNRGEDSRQFMPAGNDDTIQVASDYVRKAFRREYEPHTTYDQVPEDLLKEIADYFQNVAKHEPDSPEVLRAYQAMADETVEQYKAMIDAGIEPEPYNGVGEPYASSEEMMRDVRDNKHLYFLRTDSAFGQGTQDSFNPLLEKSGLKIGDFELLVNDVFRIVHDYFGHTQQGLQFGPRGELNAWKSHSRMYSDAAQGAVAAETLAQNAWVNFGQHLRRDDGSIPKKGDPDYVPPQDRPFGEQKNFLVPPGLIEAALGPTNRDFRFMVGETTAPEAPLAEETLPTPRGPLNPASNTAMGIIYTDNAELTAPEGGQAIGGVASMLGKAAIEENGRRISSKDITLEEEDRLANIVADEAEAALKKEGNAGDWYTAAIKRTLVIARQMFKELTDPEAAKAAGFSTIKDAELALMIAFATTSQNLDVADNTYYAIEQFESRLSTGEYDPSKKYGTKGKAVSANLRLANTLVKAYGWPGLRRFVAKDFTVGQLSKVASKILGKEVSIEGYVGDTVQGAAIFGPKIGQGFLQNLLGRFDPVTVDLWLRRTWGRLTGDIMPESIKPEQLAKWLDNFRAAGIELPPELNDIPVVTRTRRTGKKAEYRTVDEARFAQFLESPTAQNALEEINDVEAKKWQDAYSDLRVPMPPALAEEIRSGAKSLADALAEIRTSFDQREAAWTAYLDESRAQNILAKQRKKKDKFLEELDAQEGRTAVLTTDELSKMKPEWAKSAAVVEKLTKPIDAPTALDRKKITTVLQKALAILAQRGINLTNADLQATIWYPEKDIWERLSTGKKESSLKLSYDSELLKIADARGKGDAARAAIRKARIGQR
jgi:hypothetical protein